MLTVSLHFLGHLFYQKNIVSLSKLCKREEEVVFFNAIIVYFVLFGQTCQTKEGKEE